MMIKSLLLGTTANSAAHAHSKKKDAPPKHSQLPTRATTHHVPSSQPQQSQAALAAPTTTTTLAPVSLSHHHHNQAQPAAPALRNPLRRKRNDTTTAVVVATSASLPSLQQAPQPPPQSSSSPRLRRRRPYYKNSKKKKKHEQPKVVTVDWHAMVIQAIRSSNGDWEWVRHSLQRLSQELQAQTKRQQQQEQQQQQQQLLLLQQQSEQYSSEQSLQPSSTFSLQTQAASPAAAAASPASPLSKQKKVRFWQRAVQLGRRGSSSGASEAFSSSSNVLSAPPPPSSLSSLSLSFDPADPSWCTTAAAGLLQVDVHGRTVLHNCLGCKQAPVDVLLLLTQCAPRACQMPDDDKQRLPLHYAVLYHHDIEVIAQIVEAYPAGLATQDRKGQSPLSYAVERAKKQTDLRRAHKCFWMPVVVVKTNMNETSRETEQQQQKQQQTSMNTTTTNTRTVGVATTQQPKAGERTAIGVRGTGETRDEPQGDLTNTTESDQKSCSSSTCCREESEESFVVGGGVGNSKGPSIEHHTTMNHPQTKNSQNSGANNTLANVIRVDADMDDVEDTSHLLKWQSEQSERWGVVHWLLLSLATHPQTSLNVVHGQTKPMLVDCLLYAAPPPVISLLIGASAMLLSHDNRATAFAGSTLYSCIARHYPLSVLQSLCLQCPNDVRKVRDETGMGLVAAHFLSGCFEQHDQTGQEWTVSWPLFSQLQRAIQRKQLPEAQSGRHAAFLDWWHKMEYLIAFCAGEQQPRSSELTPEQVNKRKPYLLHMALRNPDIPPPVIRLLLALYPNSIVLPDVLAHSTLFHISSSPANSLAPERKHQLPIHLVASSFDYIPRNYEFQILGNELSTAEMIVQAYAASTSSISQALWYRYNKRLPLHWALDAGKTIASLYPFFDPDPRLLEQRDPLTGLYPFQHAASYNPLISHTTQNAFRWNCVARNKYSHAVWKGLSEKLKANAILRVAHSEETDRLTTVFVLLKRRPGTLRTVAAKHSISTSRDETGMGRVAAHFWNMMFDKENDDKSSRDSDFDSAALQLASFEKVNEAKKAAFQSILKHAKKSGNLVHASNEFIKWWLKLKFWLRYCLSPKIAADDSAAAARSYTTSVMTTIPVTIPEDDDLFLLHCAVANSDSPPPIVELVIALYPTSISLPLPGTSWLPLHICALTPAYEARQCENDYYEPLKQQLSALELTLNAYPDAARVACEKGLPLHVAILSGKTWSTGIQALVDKEPRALRVQEKHTRLYPFQLMAMALRRRFSPEQLALFQYRIRNKYTKQEFNNMTPIQRLKETKRMQKQYRIDSLTTVFEMLRRDPSAICPYSPDNTESCDDDESMDEEDFAAQQTLNFAEGSHSRSLLFEQSVSLLERSAASFSSEPESPQALVKEPSALMQLLSRHSVNAKESDEVFNCDASVLSGVDVMEMISSNSRHASPSLNQRSSQKSFASSTGSQSKSQRASGSSKLNSRKSVTPSLMHHLSNTQPRDTRQPNDEEEVSLAISDLMRPHDTSFIPSGARQSCASREALHAASNSRPISISRATNTRPLQSAVRTTPAVIDDGSSSEGDTDLPDETSTGHWHSSDSDDDLENEIAPAGYLCSRRDTGGKDDTDSDDSFFENHVRENADYDSEEASDDGSEFSDDESVVFFQMRRRRKRTSGEESEPITHVKLEKKPVEKSLPTRSRSMPLDGLVRTDSLRVMLIGRPKKRRSTIRGLQLNFSLHSTSNDSAYSSIAAEDFYLKNSASADILLFGNRTYEKSKPESQSSPLKDHESDNRLHHESGPSLLRRSDAQTRKPIFRPKERSFHASKSCHDSASDASTSIGLLEGESFSSFASDDFFNPTKCQSGMAWVGDQIHKTALGGVDDQSEADTIFNTSHEKTPSRSTRTSCSEISALTASIASPGVVNRGENPNKSMLGRTTEHSVGSDEGDLTVPTDATNAQAGLMWPISYGRRYHQKAQESIKSCLKVTNDDHSEDSFAEDSSERDNIDEDSAPSYAENAMKPRSKGGSLKQFSNGRSPAGKGEKTERSQSTSVHSIPSVTSVSEIEDVKISVGMMWVEPNNHKNNPLAASSLEEVDEGSESLDASNASSASDMIFDKSTMRWERRRSNDSQQSSKLNDSNHEKDGFDGHSSESASTGSETSSTGPQMLFDRKSMRWVPVKNSLSGNSSHSQRSSRQSSASLESISEHKPVLLLPQDSLLERTHELPIAETTVKKKKKKEKKSSHSKSSTITWTRAAPEPVVQRKQVVQCLICADQRCEILLLPCRHLAICKKCSAEQKKISKCPMCQAVVKDRMLIF